MRNKYFIVLFCIAVIGLGACNNIPDHAKYIPKNAAIVVGLDLKALTKKVAWNAITGSKLFQDMQKRMQGKSGKSFEDAGIDLTNTLYMYILADKGAGKGERVTALIPLTDAGKFETYVNGNFPGKPIKQQGKIKTAMLAEGMYAGWNDKLLILMNVTNMMPGNTYDDSTPPANMQPDETQMMAEMEAAFNVTPENSIVQNDRYAALEKERHDILFWMNYEQVMSQFMNNSNSAEWMSSLSGMNSFWKDAVLTTGIDFEKGRIAGEMHYYVSNDMKQMCSEFGGTNADKEMIDKLPAQNLDMLFAYHLSTKGTHDLLEKMGVLGFANLALTQQNMDVDYIMNAFTGDMALSLNNFKVKMETLQGDSGKGGMSPYKASTRFVDFVYVLKINKKQNFDKLLSLGKDMIHPMGTNVYYFPFGSDSLYMSCNDKYAVISNKAENAAAYLQNKNTKAQVAENIYGHPLGFFIDFQQLISSIDPALVNSSLSDSTMVTESRKLLQNMTVNGGDFKKNNFEYHMDLNFINKEENSLIQLMDFAMKITGDKQEGSVTYNHR